MMASQRAYASEYSHGPGTDSDLTMDRGNELSCSCGEQQFIVTLLPKGDCRPLLDSLECPQCHAVYGREAIHAARL